MPEETLGRKLSRILKGQGYKPRKIRRKSRNVRGLTHYEGDYQIMQTDDSDNKCRFIRLQPNVDKSKLKKAMQKESLFVDDSTFSVCTYKKNRKFE